MKGRRAFPGLAMAFWIATTACEPETVTDVTETESPAVDQVLEALSTSGNWEVAAHPISLTERPIDIRMEEQREQGGLALAAAAGRDLAWYAADGERYDALYIHENGRAYGRRGPARQIKSVPDESNRFGAFQGDVGGSEESPGPTLGANDLQDAPQARITDDNWKRDRRYRVSAGMTTYPTRVIGTMSGTGDTQDSGCTGTKIGPRAVLTAAHCVMNKKGGISLNGRFNPGQTNNTTPNGSLRWNGVFLRDWRVARRFDYAVIYLQDSPRTVGLGWMGVAWWNNGASYEGRGASLFGYPCGANRGCGEITSQRCKASPRADKRCDGWMYGHQRPLDGNSYRNDGLLQYDNDMSSGQSGSAVYTWLRGGPAVMAVNTHSWSGVSMGARFRQSMWNDVCSWIAHPLKQSAFAVHPLCN